MCQYLTDQIDIYTFMV